MIMKNILKITLLLALAAVLSGCKNRECTLHFPSDPVLSPDTTLKVITIDKTCCDFDREPLLRPFGFKGG